MSSIFLEIIRLLKLFISFWVELWQFVFFWEMVYLNKVFTFMRVELLITIPYFSFDICRVCNNIPVSFLILTICLLSCFLCQSCQRFGDFLNLFQKTTLFHCYSLLFFCFQLPTSQIYYFLPCSICFGFLFFFFPPRLLG